MPSRVLAAVLAAALLWLPPQNALAAGNTLPRFDHIVVVILENHSAEQIVDAKHAPFIVQLAQGGALFTNAFAVAHPSQPNYFALFSGTTHGVKDDKDYIVDAPNLASALQAAGKSFVGYVEAGSPRKHNPWQSFVNARATERNLNEFPRDFTQLPTVSFVIPDLDHDMHDGSIVDGDRWLKAHLSVYAEWAKTHNSLLIVTVDEDDYSAANRIPIIIYGAHILPGRYAEPTSHYSVFNTLLAVNALSPLAGTATTQSIRAIWN
jgi:phosphatidylinositol-3-phosphatase